MTRKLYEEDSFLFTFTATVLACEKKGDAYLAELDRTAFFPEGGGQGADHGMLGSAVVTDCHIHGGRILHTLDRPLVPGETVEGTIDAKRRFSFMQQHSGEHIFSGLVHSRFGYNNVGFHMGTDAVTMDFDGKMTREDALAIESLVNEAIWKDIPVKAEYPDPAALASIPYRSKMEIDGPVRIVTIEGYDICACCGTHVRTTGQIGQVKVIAFQNYKSGVRISILCGDRALDFENRMLEENQAISHLTSEKPGRLAPAVARLIRERDDLRYLKEQLAMKLFMHEKEALTGERRMLVADLAMSQLRPAAGTLAKDCSLALVLVPREGGWNYALSSLKGDVRSFSRELQSALGGRGGGSPDMVQGILGDFTEEQVRAAFLSLPF